MSPQEGPYGPFRGLAYGPHWRLMDDADRGHARLAHTADAVLEAWAPTAAACYEEAAAAFVDVFADVSAAAEGSVVPFDVGPGGPEELLVLLLEQILFDADARGHVPVATEVEVRGDHLVGRFAALPIEEVDIRGPIPESISSSDVEFRRSDHGWRCRATIDG